MKNLNPLKSGLTTLYCSHNQLTSLPPLNENLETCNCHCNQLTSLPLLHENLRHFHCHENPFKSIIYNPNLAILKSNMKKIHTFRYLYYCLKLKKKFKQWLWERVREPMTKQKYHPRFLQDHLHDDTDLDSFLEKW